MLPTIEVNPPEILTDFEGYHKVFLAGSIEMGAAVEWQRQLIELLKGVDIAILNPRRKDWDASWVQSIDNPQFKEQVTWELDGLDLADLIVYYFDPNTKSPITLMELGLHARRKVVVCCPDGFHRKGNVDIVCERYKIPMVKNVNELAKFVRVYDELKYKYYPSVKKGLVQNAEKSAKDFLVRVGIITKHGQLTKHYR